MGECNMNSLLEKLKLKILKMGVYKWRLWHYILLVLILIFAVPFGINEAYKLNQGYLTMWNAADALSYHGNILTFIGTIFLGYIAINQNKFIVETQTKAQCYSSIRPFSISEERISDVPIKLYTKNVRDNNNLQCMGKVLTLVFRDFGKTVPNTIEIEEIEIVTEGVNPQYKIVGKMITRDNYDSFYQDKSPEVTLVSTIFEMIYQEDEYNNVFSAQQISMALRIRYWNSFQVLTTGKYYCEGLKEDDTYYFHTAICNEEKYEISNKNVNQQSE